MHAAAQIQLIQYVVHKTQGRNLLSIFDNGFMSRETLVKKGYPFSPAALAESDILNGDQNIICFGVDYSTIDPLCIKKSDNIEITFDAKKIKKQFHGKQHNALFKLRDFGVYMDKIRKT